MTDTRIHPETGKTLRRGTRKQTVRFGTLSEVVDVSGWYPSDSSDFIHSGADLKVSNEAFKALRTKYAAHVKTVRKSLNITQEEAGKIIGGGRRAFQKYESGKTPPSVAAVGLIEMLHRHPEEIAMLRTLHKIVAPRKSKAVKTLGRGVKKSKSPARVRHSAQSRAST